MSRIILHDGDVVISLEAGGHFVCLEEPDYADICNNLAPPAEAAPQNPDPEYSRANACAQLLGGRVIDERPEDQRPDMGIDDPDIVY